MIPKHVAIIMDGNGRWATAKGLARVDGHRQGVQSVRTVIRLCLDKGIGVLTLFAFSSENWRRPHEEVDFLFSLLLQVLEKEVDVLIAQGVSLHIIGDKTALSPVLQKAVEEAEIKSAGQVGLRINIAINFGGQWDIFRAACRMAERALTENQPLSAWTMDDFKQELSLAACPPPDLFIRTGGVCRLSNFLLWDLAYTELYFTDCHWPEFQEEDFLQALVEYGQRERRFGGITDASSEK
jgi:undecaprenyl diphosphate synthase